MVSGLPSQRLLSKLHRREQVWICLFYSRVRASAVGLGGLGIKPTDVNILRCVVCGSLVACERPVIPCLQYAAWFVFFMLASFGSLARSEFSVSEDDLGFISARARAGSYC